MESRIDELLDSKGVTVAYKYPTPRALTWRCAGYANPNVFDPVDHGSLVEAQAVCAVCDVALACLALGVSRDEWGVWGGVLLEGGKPIEKVRMRGRPKRSAVA